MPVEIVHLRVKSDRGGAIRNATRATPYMTVQDGKGVGRGPARFTLQDGRTLLPVEGEDDLFVVAGSEERVRRVTDEEAPAPPQRRGHGERGLTAALIVSLLGIVALTLWPWLHR